MTTQPPDPQAIDEAVYEAAQKAFDSDTTTTVEEDIRRAVSAALACDRRLRGEADKRQPTMDKTREALGLFYSAIKCGENWDAECRDAMNAARLEMDCHHMAYEAMVRRTEQAEADLAAARAEIGNGSTLSKARDWDQLDGVMSRIAPDLIHMLGSYGQNVATRVEEMHKQLAAAQATIGELNLAIAGQVKTKAHIQALCDRDKAEQALREAQATIAGQGERVKELEGSRPYRLLRERTAEAEQKLEEAQETAISLRDSLAHMGDRESKAEQALTHAGWVRDGDAWKPPVAENRDHLIEIIARTLDDKDPHGGFTPGKRWEGYTNYAALIVDNIIAPLVKKQHPTATAGSAGETALAPGLTVFQMNDARDFWETQMRALPEGSDAALACLQIANGFKVAGFIIDGALKIREAKRAAIVAAKGEG